MASNLPAIRQQQSLTVPDEEMQRMLKQAEAYVKSGLAPRGLDTPQKALVVMLQGRELGLNGQAAVQNIYPINGNTMLSAKLTLALLKRAGYRIVPIEVSAERAKGKFISPNGDEFVYEVTRQEAIDGKWNQQWNKEKGQWEEKPAWRASFKTMLWCRFTTQGSKIFASDALLFTPADEDDSLMVYDAEDAEFVSVEEATRREAQRARDMAPIATPVNGKSRLFKDEAPRAKPVEAEPSPVLLPDMPEQDEPHWIDAPDVCGKFWAWTKSLGLKESEVYDALGVEHIHDFHGSKDDAVKTIRAWATENAQELLARLAAQKAAQPELISDQEAE